MSNNIVNHVITLFTKHALNMIEIGLYNINFYNIYYIQ